MTTCQQRMRAGLAVDIDTVHISQQMQAYASTGPQICMPYIAYDMLLDLCLCKVYAHATAACQAVQDCGCLVNVDHGFKDCTFTTAATMPTCIVTLFLLVLSVQGAARMLLLSILPATGPARRLLATCAVVMSSFKGRVAFTA